jgi:hypothetical protein
MLLVIFDVGFGRAARIHSISFSAVRQLRALAARVQQTRSPQ